MRIFRIQADSSVNAFRCQITRRLTDAEVTSLLVLSANKICAPL